MKKKTFLILILVPFLILPAFGKQTKYKVSFPYKSAGMSEEQAAIHLLNRFTFGYRPKDLESVKKQGLEKWFLEQLNPKPPYSELAKKLNSLKSLSLTSRQIYEQYIPRPFIEGRMEKAGILDKDITKRNKKEVNELYKQYIIDNEIKLLNEHINELYEQKIVNAIYSDNQLVEVLTDFWFNHFNVTMGKGVINRHIWNYERDAIRPNVLNKFNDLLLATARHPAMLIYLDNSSNYSKKNSLGIYEGTNENYARELLELHTLGVNGGYTQDDITEVAKIMSGWGVLSHHEGNKEVRDIGANPISFFQKGYFIEGDFVFRPNKHVNGPKRVVNKTILNTVSGYQEGVDLINLLAIHPSTAQHICKKIAIRFVNDEPDAELVENMAKTFMSTKGDIKSVLITMLESKIFWEPSNYLSKTKTPFELMASAMRISEGTFTTPMYLYYQMRSMGQEIYRYNPPTGYPDAASFWVNSGSLLARMNFGASLGANKVYGVKIEPLKWTAGIEPESAAAALNSYIKIMLPGRDISKTTNRLSAALNDVTKTTKGKSNDLLSSIMGIIIGSPEFQRR